jgi:nucleotide-binding universal stress UspA family protein
VVRRDGGRLARPIVVGVDGSQGSARALTWALREARDRRAPLRVVTAWVWDGAIADGGAVRQARQTQEALVRAVLAGFPGALPELATELVQGDPASALIDRSRDGDLLVLGSRGLSAGNDQVIGSVADACLRHGSCPVAVVPADSPLDLPEQLQSPGRRAGLAPAVLGALGLL